MIKEFIYSRLPTGRAWRNETSLTFLSSVSNSLEKAKDYIEFNAILRNSFVSNYSEWQKVFNLPEAVDDEQKYINIVNKFTDKGGQSVNYVEQELNRLGFDVSITLNFNPVIDPASFLTTGGGLTLGNAKAYLKSDIAYLNGSATSLQLDFIVNYIDKLKDIIYKDKFLITNLIERWKYAFFIHKKGGTIYEPARIEASRENEFRLKVLELKNFGTWAIVNVEYQ